MPKTAISPHGVKDPIGAVLAAKCFDETGGTATAREVQQRLGRYCNGSGGAATAREVLNGSGGAATAREVL
jgi:hypothetical protein